MKKTIKFVGRIICAIILCAMSAVSFIGVLAYYQEAEALPFAFFGAICFFGALAMTLHEDDQKAAPTAKNRKSAAATDEVAAA